MSAAERHAREQAEAREAARDARGKIEAARTDGPTGETARVPWAELLDGSGMTDAEVARRAGVSDGYVSLLRSGRRGREPAAQRRLREVLTAA